MQNKIVVLTGRRGGGKTSTVKQILRFVPRFLVLDVHGEYGDLPGVVTVRNEGELMEFLEVNEARPSWGGRYVSDYDVVGAAEDLCFHAYEESRPGSPVTLVLDEAHLIMSPSHVEQELGRALRLGRHKALNILLVTTRLAEIARSATAQADDFILCGRISEPNDLEALRERTGDDFARQVRDDLGRYGRLGYDAVEQEPFDIDRDALREILQRSLFFKESEEVSSCPVSEWSRNAGCKTTPSNCKLI